MQLTTPPTARARPSSPGRSTALAAGVVLGGCALSALIDPAGGPPLCPFRAATGRDCPLCGATRAAHHLLRGDVIGALGLNAMFVLLAPVLLVGTFVLLRQAFGGPPASLRWVTRRRVVAVLTALLVFAVVRNLGVAPFDWLSTTA